MRYAIIWINGDLLRLDTRLGIDELNKEQKLRALITREWLLS